MPLRVVPRVRGSRGNKPGKRGPYFSYQRREELLAVGQQRCSRCRTIKPLLSFSVRSSSKSLRHHWCKKCVAEDGQSRKYGVPCQALAALFAEQRQRCAVCRQKLKSFSVDHDHTTGRVRGLLCGTCNSGLGFFRDSVELLQEAILYLQKHSSSLI